jgi:hypothetical protein
MNIKKIVIIGLLSIGFLLCVSMIGCERIDAGSVGIKVNMAGGEKGVSKTEYVTGWQWYIRTVSKIYEFPTYQQHKEYDAFTVPTKGGTIFTVHPSFNYNLSAGNVAEMFQTFRLPLSQLEDGYLKNALMVSLREVTNTFTVDSILNNLGGYDGAVLNKLNEKLHPYFVVSTFTSRLEPDEKLKATISAKAQAIQEAIQLENEQKKIRAQVENDLLEASRDSAVRMKAANAEAQSIQVIQEALKSSPQFVEKIKAEKWNGALPVYMLGDKSNMFLDISGRKQ